MKTVLIIAYNYLDDKVIGSIRMRSLVNYLPQFGWEPIIVTAPYGLNIISLGNIFIINHINIYSFIKKILGMDEKQSLSNKIFDKNKKQNLFLGLLQDLLIFPDETALWVHPALNEICNLLNEKKIDIILSTSNPPTSHVIASIIEKKFDIPWIADFRDLWTTSHYYSGSRIRKKIETMFELFILRNAHCLTSTTNEFAKELSKLHNKTCYPILTGYDPAESKPEKLSTKFRLVYTGGLYQGKRDPELLFEALDNLIKNDLILKKDVELIFVGDSPKWLYDYVDHYKFDDIVQIHGRVERNFALRAQKEAQLLLIFSWANPREFGVIPGKIYDYLSAKRPILLIGSSKGELADIINKTEAGNCVENLNELQLSILKYYKTYKINGSIPYSGIRSEIEKLSNFTMVGNFVNIFNSSSRIIISD